MPNSRNESQTLSSDLFCMRGIGILLVVVVHVLGVDALHGVRKLFAPTRTDLQITVELIHSFNMAVMLMGSGIAVAAFGRSDLSLGDFLRKKVNKLLIPMLVWAPLLFVMQELRKGRPHGPAAWLALIQQLPTSWFPPYSIFWFVHALMGCTLLAWLFRRFAAPALGRWSELSYFALAIVLFYGTDAWLTRSGGGLAVEYIQSIFYWNRFFSLGMLVYPRLSDVQQWLARSTVTLQVLVPLAFFGLIALVYSQLAEERYETVRTINGPLGFGMLFSLSVFLRARVAALGLAWKQVWSRLVVMGSMSMTVYLFHLYFMSSARVVLEHVHAGTPLLVHLVLGTFVGCAGPWLLFHLLKGYPLFQWSIGLAPQARRQPVRREQPDEALPSLPLTPKV